MKKKHRGVICKKFSHNGYGFIHQIMNEKDIFFCVSSFSRGQYFENCHIGDIVEFEMIESEKGLSAINLKICQKVYK